MKRLNAKDSIYLVNDDDINNFLKTVNEHPHYSVMLRKNAGGLVFLWRLTLDTYYYLDRPSEEVYMDSYKLLDNPLTSFLHQLLTRNEQLKTFKLVYKPDIGLKLLTSILITKKILQQVNLCSMYEESDTSNEVAYRIEDTQHLAAHQCDINFKKNYEKQKHVLAELRAIFNENNHFQKIIHASIEEAKRMHNFILYTEVS